MGEDSDLGHIVATSMEAAMADRRVRRGDGTTRGRRTPGTGKFQELLERLAAAEAPRVFGVYAVAPGQGEVRALGWGMAFADQAVFVADTAERTTYMSLCSPERVLRLFRHAGDVRLVWPEPDPDVRPAGRRSRWRRIGEWVFRTSR
jgi:hypothetical protein